MVRAVIPHMGGVDIGPWLKAYAEKVPEGQSIVEVGCWLGGGTQYLTHDPLYVYDRFSATKSEVSKALAQGVQLTQGQDTLPLVKRNLRKGINFIAGDIRHATYDGPPIGMYVDDASKKQWAKVIRIFELHFAPNAVLFLQDYDYPMCHAQREYADKWRMVERRLAGTSCAVFRC